MADKPLNVTNIEEAKAQVSDLEVFGNGDAWMLVCKASSKAGGWMKSTKAMLVEGLGVLVQVTTETRQGVAEALTFVPGAAVKEKRENDKVVSRSICYDRLRPGELLVINRLSS